MAGKKGATGKKRAKGKKGAKDKKRAKGKKGVKGKKKVHKKKTLIAPPPSIAKVHRYLFPDEASFLQYLSEIDLNLPFYVLLKARDDCGDTLGLADDTGNSLEAEIDKFVYYMQRDPDSRDIIFATVLLDSNKFRDGELSSHPKISLGVLPTLIRWGGVQKLEGYEECVSVDQLCLFFEDESRRKCRKITCSPETYTDNNAFLCPFLPQPGEAEDTGPPPCSPPTLTKIKKKKAKKKKGKKVKKGAKGKKGVKRKKGKK